MNLLLIESTCDETAAAIVNQDREILSEVVASQDELHQRYRGVVPEIAARAHVERVLPVIHEAIDRSGLKLNQIDAIAVANTPGLSGSLIVGVVAAKSLAVALDVPLIGVNHLHAHVYACQLAAGRPVFPCVGYVVSGGHTSLFDCQSPSEFRLLGGTIDDAAGEAFDKVASMMGLSYPGGPSISKAAVDGNRKVHAFPRSFIHEPDRLQFSFSGLKTAVRYQIAGVGSADPREVELSDSQIADIAASFEEAVVDCLVAKAEHALAATGASRLCLGGGVAANRRFRARLEESAAKHGFELLMAPMRLCTDNAVMGAIAFEKLEAGQIDRGQLGELTLDIKPGLVR
jgi:N6-L-threonylcarbamoyladenine synthase